MELGFLCISLGLLILWSVENALRREHGDDGQNLVRATQLD